MISEERSSHISKQALTFPVGLLISSPKRRLAKLGRKPSNGSLQSSSSTATTKSSESVVVRQPAKNKIRRHNNRLSTVFNRSALLRDSGQGQGHMSDAGDMLATDDPSELSNQMSAPGILKIFGNDICQGANYKSVLATTRSSAKELVKEALERYCLDKAEAGAYVLCDVIGRVAEDRQWTMECFRIVGDNEKPLILQSLWKPKEGFARRFEIQKRASVEEKSAEELDTVTAGINAQARKLQKGRSRVTSVFIEGSGEVDPTLGMWRSLSEMNLSVKAKGEGRRGHKAPPQEDQEAEADKETHCLGHEKEETESSDDNATQYSIHPPFDFPYFLLLQGYSYRQDFVIYLMSGMTTIFGRCSEHSTGEDVERLKVDILLSAPDILPQHCCVRRLEATAQGDGRRTVTLLKPLHGAPVTRNGAPLKDEAELRPGDLIGLGEHYLFMFKDPTAAVACQTPPWLAWSSPQTLAPVCNTCGSSLPETQIRVQAPRTSVPLLKDPEGQDLVLQYEPEHEDRILREIVAMADPHGDDPKLTPALLMCLCIQHSATSFQMSDFRRLLLRVASQVQMTMWEKTKELAAIQPETMSSGGQQDPEELQLLSIQELIPGLRPLLLWMANAIELLHFVQQEVPQLLRWSPEEEEENLGLDSHLSSTQSASEEAMTVLEEVIMFTFQQSVYYLTKTLYSALPGLLDSNPFSENGQLLVPEGVSSILDVLKQTLQLLNSCQVHTEIASQLFAYLFFFTNASLFNALMERGSGGGFYQWSRGVQIRANLDLVMDWVQGVGLGELASDFFQKLSSAVNLLATPKENLLQSSWCSLRTEFVHLNPAQLHHMLREYNPGRSCPASWSPAPEEADTALSTADILESFDNHPPLILPSSSFHLELGKPVKDASLCAQLGRLQEFLLGLREPAASPVIQSRHPGSEEETPSEAFPSIVGQQDSTAPVEPGVTKVTTPPGEEEESGPQGTVSATPFCARAPRGASGGDLSTCEAVLTQKLKNLELQSTLAGEPGLSCHKRLALDPSCLLTPPNTPQGQELAELEADAQEGATRHALAVSLHSSGHQGNGESLTPACVDGRSGREEEEEEEVFAVELQRGPHGLGLALVDGMRTPLKINGIYIKSVIPESPAALCQKLSLGDRILAVNGFSLVGMDYHSGRELIRTSGDRLRLLNSSNTQWDQGVTMNKLKKDIVNLCQHYPQGLPLLKVPHLYRTMYKKPLDLGPGGLSELEGLLESMADELTLEYTQTSLIVRPAQSHQPHCGSPPSYPSQHPAQMPLGAPPAAQTKDCNKGLLQQLQGEVLYLLRSTPGGVELPKLRSRYKDLYGRQLTLSDYGLGGLQELLMVLGNQVCVERLNNKNVVKEASQSNCRQHLADKGPKSSGLCLPKPFDTGRKPSRKTGTKMEKACLDVLELLKQHPEGVPIKSLSNAFNQRYQRNLSMSELGFSSVTQFVDSLKDEVLVENDVAFHRSDKSASGGAGTPGLPLGSARAGDELPRPPSGTPLSQRSASAQHKEEELTEAQLLDRVVEVMKVYPPANTSLAQLQNGYFHHFHTTLPLELYKSLYDSREPVGRAPAVPQGPPELRPGPPAGTQKQKARGKRGKELSAGVTDEGADEAAWSEPDPPSLRAFPAAATPALPTGLSGADFPALGATLSKSQEKKLGKGSAPVFRDAYFAQVRETHRDTMRAMEMLEESRAKGKRRVTVDEVNSLAEDVIRAIANEGEMVTVDKVICRICRLLQVPSLQSVKIDPRWQLSAIKDLLRTIREVNIYIESVEAVQTVCTLYEVGQGLASLKNMKRFEELNLGPLCKMPLIHKMFKVDSTTKDDDINQIETVDILRSLREFRKKGSREKVDLAEFMKYLADQYNCDSPYELGIRIQSVALAISNVQKAVRSEHTAMDKAKAAIQAEIEEEVTSKMRKVKRNVLDAAQGTGFSSAGSLDLRRKYACLTAAEVVLEVFKHAREVFSSRMAKHVQDFLVRVTGDRLSTALFQLAICGGSLDVPQDLVAKENAHKPTEDNNKREQKSTTPPPSEAAVKQYLQESLSSFSGLLSLPYVSRLEKKVAEHFKCGQFGQLEQGTFLEFLVKPGISQILQEAGGGALALSSQDSQAGGFRPSRQDVYEFIKQCGVEDQDRLPFIESALRSHYRIRDSRELGYGPLSTLVGYVRRQKQLSDSFGASLVCYESPLFVKDSRGCADETVGLLGPVGRDTAVASLASAPLLEDLAEWAEWELVFEPQHGPLKDFIERHCATSSGLAALERALDPVGTAGHLVSIVVADGVANAPAALLANHMESSLAPAVTQEDLSGAEDLESYTRVAKFILDCLVRIPTRICKAFLQQVFLEPLSKVLGQAKSKAVLLQTAKLDTRHLNRLHHLGLLLGLTEWVKDFQTKLRPPKLPVIPSPVKKLQAADSMSMSSRSSVGSGVELSEDDFLEESRPEPDSNSESSSLSLGDQDDDEEEKFELVQNGEVRVAGESVDDSGEDVEGERLEKERPDGAEPAGSWAEERLSEHRAIIDDIRKSEFGIGVELNEEGQKLMRVHQERLGRSLDRLSAELYSKDTHFVLELIQNADDNSYPLAGGVQPALAFVLERDCIIILNNESGFEERNIRAICDVGRSTKGKHKYGYIGQKGIGFKSVFKVTDRPEIHSNDFHICFDKNSGPMGYILPHWLEEDRPVCTDLLELQQHSWTTKISLPLRSESYQTRNLFHDVHPSLLLFLHRLRSITIVNQNDKRQVSMTRRDLSHSVLEVQHTDGVERWLVVKRTLNPKMIKEGVESTELALAFKLKADSSSDTNIQPEKQPVFAFLPLRSFGFRFIIQGDFDIPSSREDVDRDSYWNQWLRSEIPQLFLQAMDTFAEHPEFTGLQGLCHFLQFIPLPDEILDFFNPVAGQIIQLLKGKACLPTKEREDGSVEYKLPSQIAVSHDPLVQEVIGAEHLHRHLNLSYLHPALQSALPPSLELVEDDGTFSDSSLKKVAKLLVCNFRALEQEYDEADAILKTLRDIPVIPLADGRKIALSGVGAFFPLTDGNNSQTGIEALYKDLSIVAPRLLECLDPLGNSQVRELLKRLEVHELEPQEVLHQHIYPILKSGAWKMKPDDIIISYVVFIKQNSCNQDYSTLSTAIPVRTNKGFLCPSQSKVQFSKDYGNIDLPKKLPGVEWVLLDPCYLKVDRDASSWREFFSVLGVQDLLIFKKEKRSMSSKELASSPWATDSEMWPPTADGIYVVEDHECEEFRSLVTADHLPSQQKREQRMELLSLLDKNWVTGDRYSQYLSVQVLDSQGRHLKDAKSSFLHFLTSLPWVPADRIQPWNSDKRSVEYLCPSAVHLYSHELYRQLGIHVSYVSVEPSEFSRAVGMKHSISVDEMIAHLTAWCTKASDSCPGAADGEDFVTTVDHVHSVYSYLYDNCNLHKLKDLFQQTAAVFIEYERKDQWCSGKFYMLKEVCWSDPTAMFVRYKDLIRKSGGEVQEPRVLAPFYNHWENMQDFFLKYLSVEPHPSMKQYVDLLELICASWPLPSGDLLQDIFVIYAKLADKCKTLVPGDQEHATQLNSSYCMSLKTMLADKRVLPTKDNRWVTLSQRPLIPDNKTLEKVFKLHNQMCLLNLPPADKRPSHRTQSGFIQGRTMMGDKQVAFNESDRTLFLKICDVKTLSQCVTTEALTENYRPCPPMQALIHRVVPYIQKFLFHHEEFGYIYDEQKENVAQLTKALSFGQVGKLYILYRLSLPDGESIFEQEDVICLLKDKKEFYIQKDHLSAKLDICREMVKLFSTDRKCVKDLERFLQGLMSCLDDDGALKRFLRDEDIKELPDHEEKWEVPEPLEIKPEPPVFSGVQFSRARSVAEEERKEEPEDGERTLASWPPKSSFGKVSGSHTGQAVEAVMKMWPPPAQPASTDGETAPRLNCTGRTELPLCREQGHMNPQSQSSKPSGNTPYSTDMSYETGVRMAHSSDTKGQEASGSYGAAARPEVTNPEVARSDTSRPAEHAVDTEQQAPHSSNPNHKEAAMPEVVSTLFQGSGFQRPPLVLDNPVWAKQLPPQAVLEDLVLDCSRPKTVVFSEDKGDTMCIGEWGEQLVNAFFTHWKESGSPDSPREITWYNRNGESGHPCDFKVVFATDGEGKAGSHEVFVEVKSTVKTEKYFIHLSANELDLALREKERYHIYRVYNAGDSQNVRLCRIKNLAQHLHSKELELFLFV
ncbi:hypothetical protein AAFF_G00082350 [Aldrovandia affinis]|uniref:Uncharacterized protein n=1 Tax=Aldrovandia affinis TaxID=143900 RepID=A0AAD7WYK6_9TELE|nr:hypothetical protein AAFF_G00082350 [Aldrovandia affinis]